MNLVLLFFGVLIGSLVGRALMEHWAYRRLRDSILRRLP